MSEYYNKRGHHGSITSWGIIIVSMLVLLVLGIAFLLGVGVWGPTKVQDVTVQRTYVDFSGAGDSKESHYMVGTDQGVFEADNSLLMWIWNADELYAKLRAGKRYRITTEGNKVVNMFFQEYPYITAVEELAAEQPALLPVEASTQTVGSVTHDFRKDTTPVLIILRDGTEINYK